MSDELILAISGNDIFSGGGLHADLATFTTNKQHGFVALTCLTAMTEHGFEVIPIDSKVFKQQLESLIDVPFSAIKIGLLPNVEIAELTLDFVKNHPGIPIVLDPVLVCKETHDVEVSRLRNELVKFFPYVTVITPNLPEAELLIDSKTKALALATASISEYPLTNSLAILEANVQPAPVLFLSNTASLKIL